MSHPRTITHLLPSLLDMYAKENINIHDIVLDSPSKTILDDAIEQINSRLPTIVAILSDCNDPLNSDSNRHIILRTGLFRSLKKNNEFVLPYVWECSSKAFKPLEMTSKPIVGFCGAITHPLRKDALDALIQGHKDNMIFVNFNVQQRFWGGNPHHPDIVKQFDNNIMQSHFTLCIRGAGNFSMRFYQVLAFGRIPVFVDTDCVLPFESKIDYSNIIVYCKSVNEIIPKIMEIWDKNDIVRRQKECRRIYEEYFIESKCVEHIVDEVNCMMQKKTRLGQS